MNLIVGLLILLLASPAMAQDVQSDKLPQGWYWSIKPPGFVGPPAEFGPYRSLAACRDTLGSAQNAHPFACHITGPNPPANCRILKKNNKAILGFGYPTAYGPIPPGRVLPSLDCYEAPVAGGLAPGWYFPHFTPDGGVKVEKCSNLKKVIALRKKNKYHRIGYYFNRKCPGAPCITSNVSTACN